MSITIITDSAADLPNNIIEEYNIRVMRMKVAFDDKVYIEGEELNSNEFYHKLLETDIFPVTSQITPLEFEEVFKEELGKGNEVLGIFLSAEFSGTLNSARIAKEEVDKEDKIHIIDSKNVSLGLSLIVIEAARMIKEGIELKAVIERTKKNVENNKLVVIIDTLKYLQKGGRLSTGSAVIGNMLNIKPICIVEEGKLIPISKVRGLKKGISKIVDELGEEDLTNKTIVLANAFSPENMELLRKKILEKHKVKEIIEISIGPIVGTHSGPGAVGYAYIRG